MYNLRVRNIYKKYGQKSVIKGVDLDFKSGECVTILGPNGAGKTTLFYILTGLVDKFDGKIELDSLDITHFPIYLRSRLGISYLPQEPSIFKGLTVWENIMMVLEFHEKDIKTRQRKCQELLERFSIQGLKDSYATFLSGGERRRLEIARALVSKPKFLLLDEPFAGVDPVSVNEIIEVINILKNDNIGVILTDHNVRETLKTSDRSYIIYGGQVIVNGTKEDVLNDPTVRKYYLGEEFNI